MKTQAVIFDLDDTLYPEKQYTFSGYRAVADAFAPRLQPTFDLFDRLRAIFDSPDRLRAFNVVVSEASVTEAAESDALVAEMIDVFRNHAPSITLFPEADEALRAFAGDYKLGIISDGYLVTQTRKVEALRLADRVDEIILTDALGREHWKPHPKAFEQMAERLQIPHAACVYIADNLAKDFVAPNALGWRTIHIAREDAVHRHNTAPAGGEPMTVVQSLSNISSVIATF